MKTTECSACGAEAKVVRGSYSMAEVGLPVVLHGIGIIRCKKCGNADPVIPRMNDLMRLLALAVVAKPYRLKGEEIRFLRKYLQMTQDEFSRFLDVDKTTLSKWENNDDRVGDQSDRLIRTLALALGEGLQDKLREVVEMFPKIRKSPKRTRIEIDAEKMSYEYA